MKYFVLFFLGFLISCSVVSNQILVQNLGSTQGTFYHIQYISENGKDYQVQIDSLLQEVDNSLSMWNPNSLISRINGGDKVKVNEMFADVFYAAEKVYLESEGAFDCTIAPLTNYWGFGPEDGPLIVDSAKVSRLLQLVNYSKLKIVDDSLLLPEGMQLDYNSIAQGYSVDIIANFLQSQGILHYLIEIGGELRSKGKNADKEVWIVGVEKPIEIEDDNQSYQIILSLDNASLATSGNYRKYKEINNVKYSHTISTTTGYFENNRMLSVTVIHPDCVFADAYATAFMAMGIKRSKEFINNQSELDVYFVYTDINGNWKDFMTNRLEKQIKN